MSTLDLFALGYLVAGLLFAADAYHFATGPLTDGGPSLHQMLRERLGVAPVVVGLVMTCGLVILLWPAAAALFAGRWVLRTWARLRSRSRRGMSPDRPTDSA